ncbi:hypothetical protein PV326_001322 [Microctonus aethiopoides]|uniref:Uncharacterized protein n=1 Tax=Microctonus aethiopoides TaxID=144406 RepID=A0AA39CA95_9HYME|nr:hypothetical protein PV326_001322 [Microctonus aethiopoides]KAK0160459.1 hypothetical protein PV328_007868 [Microctonus aethiopoides]
MSKPDATLVEKAAAIGCSQPQDLIFFDQEGIIQDENNVPLLYHWNRHSNNKNHISEKELTKLQKDLGIKTAPNNKFTPNLNSARGKTRAPTDIKDFSATLNADTSTKDNCVAEPSTSKPTDTTD